jgi:hypothetical protein
MNETEIALATALAQTGFPFEHHIFDEARRRGWTTIPNRLYVDAEEDKTREMDLLCYRADAGGHGVTVYTVLLISCKSRTEKPWVMMTRPWPSQRPAWFPYPPVPVWTNSVPVRYESSQLGWGLEYFNLARCTGLEKWSEDSREEVFALQEFDVARDGGGKKLNPLRYKSLGDTSLYTGSMSLLKALAYELAAVEGRRSQEKDKLAYQFNLIQMIDGDLYEASFAGGAPMVRPVDRYRYFARTMLGGKEHSARIDFCTRTELPGLLADMANLHRFNVLHFNELGRRFFEGLFTTQGRLDALLPLLEPTVTTAFSVFFPDAPKPGSGWVRLFYREDGSLKVELDCRVEGEALRSNEHFVDWVASKVRGLYRFTGAVWIDDDIPF